jgi:hypothetical protein
MKKPANLNNPNSPEVILKDLRYGLQNNTRLSGLDPGSCQRLENFIITESNSLQTVPGYTPYNSDTEYKIISIPLSIIDPDATQSTNTQVYCIALDKQDRLCLIRGGINAVYDKSFIHLLPDQKYSKTALYRMVYINERILIYNGKNLPIVWAFRPDADRGLNAGWVQWVPLTPPKDSLFKAPVLTKTNNIPDPSATESWTFTVTVSYLSTIGHTMASAKATIKTAYDLADFPTEGHLTVTLPNDVPQGALAWNVYMAVGDGVLLGVNKDPIKITTTHYNITKDVEIEIDMLSPTDNSTNPIVFNYANVINSRLWITQINGWNNSKVKEGLEAYPYTVAWSGTGKRCFEFTDSVGGGFVDIELGTVNTPQSVLMFRKNDGSTAVIVLTGGVASLGKRFVMNPEEVRISQNDSHTVQGFAPEEQLSAVGTVGGWSSIAVDTFLGFLSAQGFISTSTNQNTFNILSNNNISLKIQSIVDNINSNKYKDIQVVTYATRVFWLIPNTFSSFILVYDYIKDAFSTIEVSCESIFIDTAIPSRLKLGIVKEGRLYYFDLTHIPVHPVLSRLLFNYIALGRARTHTQFGRLIESTAWFEHLEPGEINFEFNGISKDSQQLNDKNLENLPGIEGSQEYRFYTAHHKLYRDKIIADKVNVSIEAHGLAYSLDELHIVYDPSPVDFAKNRFSRTRAELVPISNDSNFVLQPLDWVGRTKWDDRATWNDNLYWKD